MIGCVAKCLIFSPYLVIGKARLLTPVVKYALLLAEMVQLAVPETTGI